MRFFINEVDRKFYVEGYEGLAGLSEAERSEFERRVFELDRMGYRMVRREEAGLWRGAIASRYRVWSD